MVFSSPSFVFYFLPITLLCYVFAQRFLPAHISKAYLFGATLIFFGWNYPAGVIWLLASIGFNFAISIALQSQPRERRTPLLASGIVCNLVFLGIFRYLPAVAVATEAQAGSFASIGHAIPMLAGVSFFTFQQITYLVQISAGSIRNASPLSYAGFVGFFPYIISGPILRYSEIAPQFNSLRQLRALNLQVGLALFTMGLIKKVFLADELKAFVDPIFAAPIESLSLLDAWAGALCFTLQVYFDFSGYSDMAIGIARLFGIRLPANFYSPYKATSIVEFWRRWHMTMTRFFTDFVYNPLALSLTRYSMRRRHKRFGGFVVSVAGPTIFTFVLVGFWHDAGFPFLLFGLIHGIALSVNQIWRVFVRRKVPGIIGWAMTFLFVVVTLVLFRAADMDTVLRLWKAMFGLTFISLPGPLAHIAWASGLGALLGSGLQVGEPFVVDNVDALAMIVYSFIGLAICLILPNTVQLMRRYQPVVTFPFKAINSDAKSKLVWRPNWFWSALTGIAFGCCALKLLGADVSTFIYFRF